jgi:hypothetical protein
MNKWYSITGTYEYLILSSDEETAIEQAEEDFLNMGMSILSVDSVKEY